MWPQRLSVRWHMPLPLFFSLVVNVYILLYLILRQPCIRNTRTDDIAVHNLAANSRTADFQNTQIDISSTYALDQKLLFGSAWPSLTGAAPEVWAAGTLGSNASLTAEVEALLQPQERDELWALCGRCLHQTITESLEVRGIGESVFVATGDIPDEWIRDSSVQLAVYLPRLAEHPVLRPIIEGAIRTQAYFILSDPWANSYRQSWVRPKSLGKFDRQIGRGGWVATRNWEVDSGAYWLNLLWNYASTPGALWGAAAFLNSSLIHDAAALLLDTWTIEQRHETLSPYRYAELPREGRGAPTNYTGMIWSGFRPSDDPNTYGYNIPVNMYAAGALERLVKLNRLVWRDPVLGAAAGRLAADIRAGIEKHGVITPPGAKQPIYAYEVDGRGGVLASFDDPNVPSLLAMPLLGYEHYDPSTYSATRARILSKANPFYFSGTQLSGCGSPHTPQHYVWSLATCVQALTSGQAKERAQLLRQLLKMQGTNGLMHESNDVDHPEQLTRPLFQWANTMLVVAYEQTFGQSCSKVSEELRLLSIKTREAGQEMVPRNGGPDLPAYYERLEQNIPHVA